MSDAVKTAAAPETEAPTATAPQSTDAVDEIAAALAAVEADAAADEGGDAKKEPKAEAKEGEPAEKKDEPEKQDDPKEPAAKGWAAVRRVEQRLVKRQKEFEAKEQAFESRMAQLEQHARTIQEREAALETDPVAYLAKKGLSFDDLAKRYLGDGKPGQEEAAKRASTQQEAVLREIRERQERIEASLQQRDVNARLDEYRSGIKTTMSADEFELLRAWPDAEAEVLEFADKWAARHREVLTPRDAAAKLQTELQKQLTHLSSHQAVRKLLAGSGAQSKQAVSGQSQAPRGSTGESPKTLTNNLAATPAAEPNLDPMDEDEELQTALRLVQGY